MKDYLKQYSQKNFKTHLSILGVSFILALGIYFFAGDTNLGNYLKTNVQEAWNIEAKIGDVYLERDGSDENQLFLRANKNIDEVKAFSISFTYNWENLNIVSMESLLKDGDIQNISNDIWINTIFLQYTYSRNINKWDYLMLIKTNRKRDVLENLNIINANFKDITGENYELSTSGIDF